MPTGKPTFTNIKDKKIAIYKSRNIKDGYGEVLAVWEPINNTKLWACYHSLSGNQIYYAAMTAGFTEDCSFTVNWRRDITQGMHVVYGDRVFEVTRVDDLEGYKKDLKLLCKVVNNSDIKDYPDVR